MWHLPNAIRVIIMCVAFYFALHWGIDAIHIFRSPVYGLDDPLLAQIVHGIGRVMQLTPDGMVRCAAFFGALKLTIAGVFTIYLMDRMRGLWGEHKPNHELLDSALVLVVLSTFAAALPVFVDAPHLLAQFRVPLWMASLAATLSMLERAADAEDHSRVKTIEREISSRRKPELPPRRGDVHALRWDILRRDANIVSN